MHVLQPHVLVRAIEKSWATLWTTRVGPIPLAAMHVDAQIIGKFFQELLMRDLHAEDARWRAPDMPRTRHDPDFVFLGDPTHDFELKMCGQIGGRHVFGNRCAAPGFASTTGAKTRNTWLLAINYSGTTLNLIRFGFVTENDWIGQRAASGNASRLAPEVYATKLRVLEGRYRRTADARILRGPKVDFETVGEAAEAGCAEALRFLECDFY